MSGIRFATSRALFETFPQSITKLAVAPTDESPVIFLKSLLAREKFEDAVTFCAYLLPRREAVWWGCKSMRAFLGDVQRDRPVGLAAAEAWVQEPDDQHREAALAFGVQGDVNNPMTWLAFAAGWSGGSLSSNPKMPVPAPHYLTARAVRLAVLLSARSVQLPVRSAHLRSLIADGIQLAETGL
jgi:hypothetical protein